MTETERKPRPRHPNGQTDWDSVPELADPNITDQKIANIYGCKRAAVTMARLARGLRRRSRYGERQYDVGAN